MWFAFHPPPAPRARISMNGINKKWETELDPFHSNRSLGDTTNGINLIRDIVQRGRMQYCLTLRRNVVTLMTSVATRCWNQEKGIYSFFVFFVVIHEEYIISGITYYRFFFSSEVRKYITNTFSYDLIFLCFFVFAFFGFLFFPLILSIAINT